MPIGKRIDYLMSLRIKLLTPLFVFSLLLVFYFYAHQMPNALEQLETEHRIYTENHLDSIIEGLIPLLLGHQLDAVYENLDSLLENNPNWISIQILNADGKNIYPIPPPSAHQSNRANSIRSFERRINFIGSDLGKLILISDISPILIDAKKRIDDLMLSLLAGIAVFTLIIAIMLEGVVRRPVRLLANASKKLADGDFEAQLMKTGNDEMSTLIDSFAVMRDSIRKYQTDLIQKNESLIKLSRAVEQSPVSIVITDTSGDIEFVNPRFLQTTGYSEKEVIGKKLGIMKSVNAGTNDYKMLWETISSGRVWQGEFHNKKKNGEVFYEYASISPIKNKDGVITHYLGIKEDITDRKKLEAQLIQSQKMEAVGQLAGGIAHDFNNILTAIMGYGSLLSSRLEAEKKLAPEKQYAEQILTASEKAANLISQLLSFSRKQMISPRLINLNEIITGMEKFTVRLLGEDIEINTNLFNGELPVFVDAGQIGQVLMNLYTNARDAMPKGGLLTIRTDIANLSAEYVNINGLHKPGMYAIVSVTDTGSGINEDIRDKIFEPFFTTKEIGKGTGLGLSIAYGIVKQHNGLINVYGENGKGTTFKIFLPFASDEIKNMESEDTVDDKKVAKYNGAETILIAEDDEAVRSLAQHVLEENGYKTLAARDGDEAVVKFRESNDNIQLLILDLIMPKKNGKEAYDEIRQLRPDIKAIFISGYTAEAIRKKGIFQDDIDFISKPALPSTLLCKVREVLDKTVAF